VRSRAQSPKSEEATVPEPLANSGVPLLACKSGTTSLDLAVLVRQNEKRLEKDFFFESAVDFSFEKSPKVCLLT